MDGTPTTFRRMALRGLATAVAMALPATASAPAFAEDDFDVHFSSVSAPTAFVPAIDAVDVTMIDPASDPVSVAGTGIGSGVASYYADKFNGRRTASGEAFSNGAMTAAHRTLPFGTKLRVTNPANGKSVVVRVNDRGPFHGGRVIDLSKTAASQLGIVARGHGRVELARLD